MTAAKIIHTGKTRYDLVKLFRGIGAEIGVEQGAFSEYICQSSRVKKLFSVDAWKAYSGYKDHTRQKKLDMFFETTKKRLKPYNCEIIRKFSHDATHDFMDESLDFVYIDANHDYKHVYEDINLWSKKVRKGGIVSGHDYMRISGQGESYDVVNAVNDFVKINKITKLLIYEKESPPSWAFKK